MLKGKNNKIYIVEHGVVKIKETEKRMMPKEEVDENPFSNYTLWGRQEALSDRVRIHKKEHDKRFTDLEEKVGQIEATYETRPRRSTVDTEEVAVCKENQEAFRKLLPALLKDPNKRDCYVAIWEGREWDSDENEFVLAKRMFGSVGADKSFFIGLVSSTEPYLRLPSPRRLG